MEQIITLTLNPAFDRHCACDDFQPYSENLAQTLSLDAGGKGVNCSRALTANGTENLALVILGSDNADAFCRTLREESIPYRAVLRAGSIRENLTLHQKNAPETRISFSGFSADASALRELDGILDRETTPETPFLLVFSGRIPDGISKQDCMDFLTAQRNKGARLVIDSKSFTREDLIALHPFLIKPNEDELALLLPEAATDPLRAAHTLCANGIESVAVSFGERGALLVSGKEAFFATPPHVSARSTIGAGDSFLAGFLTALANGRSTDERLRTAVAYGSAACLRDGTKPPLPHDVTRLLPLVKIEPLALP